MFILLFNGIEVTPTTTIKNANQASNLLPNDRILEIDGMKVSSWYEITEKIQKGSKILLSRHGSETEVVIDSLIADSLIPLAPPIAGNIQKNSPADKAGMKKGNRILKIQNKFSFIY